MENKLPKQTVYGVTATRTRTTDRGSVSVQVPYFEIYAWGPEGAEKMAREVLGPNSTHGNIEISVEVDVAALRDA